MPDGKLNLVVSLGVNEDATFGKAVADGVVAQLKSMDRIKLTVALVQKGDPDALIIRITSAQVPDDPTKNLLFAVFAVHKQGQKYALFLSSGMGLLDKDSVDDFVAGIMSQGGATFAAFYDEEDQQGK